MKKISIITIIIGALMLIVGVAPLLFSGSKYSICWHNWRC